MTPAALSSQRVNDLLPGIIARLRSALNPVAIYLFGSWAEGRGGEDSAIDLLVIVPESAASFFQRCAAARSAIGSVGVPVDVVVYTAEEFGTRSDWPVSFEQSVKTKGRVLYAA